MTIMSESLNKICRNQIKRKIMLCVKIFSKNTKINYVPLQLASKVIIKVLKEDAKIIDHFHVNELEEILVGLCNKKHGNYGFFLNKTHILCVKI